MASETTPVRFGIMGCADIARKISRAINLSPDTKLVAVASRSLDKAKAFAKANNFPPEAKIYDSYESLLDDPDVDAVYIPLPTSMHLNWACLSAQRKKHILLEKPVTLNVGEFDKILEACVANGVQIMDGTMWIHHPRTHKMKEFLNNKEAFGHLKTVHSYFTFAGDEDFFKNDIRVKPDLDSLGVLGDAGWYGIRAILWAADYELPKTVVAMPGPALNDEGVLLSCGASLHWEDGKVGTFHCSFLAHLTMDITVIGTMGNLRLIDFLIPVEEKATSFVTTSNAKFDDLVTGWAPSPIKHAIQTDLPQEVCMVGEFARLIGNIKRNGAEADQYWPSITRKTQLVLDLVKASIDTGFKPVEVVT